MKYILYICRILTNMADYDTFIQILGDWVNYHGEHPYTIKKENTERYKQVCYRASNLGIKVKQFGSWKWTLPLGMSDIYILEEMCKIRECRMRRGYDVKKEPSGNNSDLRKNAEKYRDYNVNWDYINHRQNLSECLNTIVV